MRKFKRKIGFALVRIIDMILAALFSPEQIKELEAKVQKRHGQE